MRTRGGEGREARRRGGADARRRGRGREDTRTRGREETALIAFVVRQGGTMHANVNVARSTLHCPAPTVMTIIALVVGQWMALRAPTSGAPTIVVPQCPALLRIAGIARPWLIGDGQCGHCGWTGERCGRRECVVCVVHCCAHHDNAGA